VNAPATGRFLAALTAGTLLLGGCAANAPLTPRAANEQAAEIQRLKDRVLELQRRLSVTEVELDRLRREVARLKGDPIAESRPRPVPDRREPARGLSDGESTSEPAPPRRTGRDFEIEDIEEPPVEARPRGSAAREQPPDRPPRAVEEPVTPAEPMPAARDEDAPGREASPTGQELTAEAQSLYDQGYTLYHQGRYVDAESTFRRFLQAHAGTELADNAQYWIGEARYARGDLDAALAAFRETASRFPEGNKVPDALLKAGETQAALGDTAGARESYREVVRRFPGTTAAAVAEDRLAGLQ
jgi:tol-pal system protein YbgF